MDSANVATIECVADKALSTAISSSLIVSVDVESVETTELLSLIDISTDCSMTATCFPVITEMMVSMAPSPKVSIKYFIKWKILSTLSLKYQVAMRPLDIQAWP